MSKEGTGQCPVCGTSLREHPIGHARAVDAADYDCPRCGKFGLTHQAKLLLTASMQRPDWTPKKVAAFAHAVRKMQMAERSPLLDTRVVQLVLGKASLPGLQEQADTLIRLLGVSSSPGEPFHISYIEHGAILGVHSLDGLHFLVKGLIDRGILQGSLAAGGHASVTLSFDGWSRFEELRRGAPSGRNAFMAMEYGDARLDEIVDKLMRPAIAATGFDLKRLDDEPRAGLIDDRLRVEIQGARFLIADLTHQNQGAYWEAGYAEGLGKPVIYTCEKCVFEEKGSHFDTNHHLHVLWEHENLPDFVNRLKATIRATIPEAKKEDS